MWGRMSPLRIVFPLPLESVLGQWLESSGWILCCIWAPTLSWEYGGPLLPVLAFVLQYVSLAITLTGELGQPPPTACLPLRGNERVWPCSYTRRAMPPLTSPSVTLAPRLPSSPTVVSMSALFILHSPSSLPFHTYRHAAVSPLSAVRQRCPIKKVGPHFLGDH